MGKDFRIGGVEFHNGFHPILSQMRKQCPHEMGSRCQESVISAVGFFGSDVFMVREIGAMGSRLPRRTCLPSRVLWHISEGFHTSGDHRKKQGRVLDFQLPSHTCTLI